MIIYEMLQESKAMTPYELMIKTNHHLIKGGEFTEGQRTRIINELMAAKTTPEQTKRFYLGVKYPNNTDNAGRHMYPMFFIPPYNDGMKYKTILNQTPKTHLLSANMYELEILRLLYLFALENREIQELVSQTLKRLKTTCFGYQDDGIGECFDTSLIVLRFLSTVEPGETEWIYSRIENYNHHSKDKKRQWFTEWYYWLCLSELPFNIAKPELDKYKAEMLNWLTHKSCVMNSEHDKTIHPVILCILRNCLCKYSEYEYIKDKQPYVCEKDNRLYFDMTE